MAEDRPADRAGFCIKAGSMPILAFPAQIFHKGLDRKVRIRPAGRERGNPFGAGGSAFACRRSGNPEPGKGRPVFGMGIALYI